MACLLLATMLLHAGTPESSACGAADVKQAFHFEKNDPRYYGAVYDGVTDCTEAIERCLQENDHIRFSGNGVALISSAIVIDRDNIHIELDQSFTIKLKDGVISSIIDTPARKYRWDDKRVRQSVLHNITIEGGTLCGNGTTIDKKKAENESDFYMMNIVDVDNFHFHHVTLQNGSCYGLMAGGLERFHVHDISFVDMNRVCNDGLHFCGMIYDGVIENVKGVIADDMIALNIGGDWHDKSFDPLYTQERQMRVGNAERITIRNVNCEGSQRAVRFLSGATSTFKDIVVDGVYGNGTITGGVIALTTWQEPSHYDNIVLRNIYCKHNVTTKGLVYLGNDNTGIGRGRGCYVRNLKIENVHMTIEDGKTQCLLSTFDEQINVGTLMVDGVVVDCEIPTSTALIDASSANVDNAIVSNVVINAPSSGRNTCNVYEGNAKRLIISNSILNTSGKYKVMTPDAVVKESNIIQL